MKVWIDIKNSHEPLFFKSVLSKFPDYQYKITCRDYAEVPSLLDQYNIKHKIVGQRPEGSLLKRRLGFFWRVLELTGKIRTYDLSLSHYSGWAIYSSKLRGKKHIAFNDNDINPDHSKFMKYVDYLITPKCIPKRYYTKNGMQRDKIQYFNGFKEDIYIADYKPDVNFLNNLPFQDFVALRPENLQAMYYKKKETIVPELINKLTRENIPILYLPRYKSDWSYLGTNKKNIFIPESPLNGLDICYYSKAVLTGAGTFSREAACMGKSAVSFFNGNKLLSVDREMIRKKSVFHSRDPDSIVDYILSKKASKPNFNRSKMVQKEAFTKLQGIFESFKK